jgi:hypothetical protein
MVQVRLERLLSRILDWMASLVERAAECVALVTCAYCYHCQVRFLHKLCTSHT